MNKQQRQASIRQIISQRTIGSQEDLSEALREAGVEVTQATLSRDLKEMGIARVGTADGSRYIIPQGSEEIRLRSFLSYEIVSIESNETLVVIRTLAGRAQGVAELIDHLQIPGMLGTIAGDNTIFVAPASRDAIETIKARLREEAGG